MASRRPSADDHHEWFHRAHSNLTRARQVTPQVLLEDLCFDAQQAAEKAIKAIFRFRGQSFPYTHNIARLLKLLEQSGLNIPKYVRRGADLTRYAAETRYPGLYDPVSMREYHAILRIAETVVK